MALLWILNLSDGRHSLLDIAERSGLGFSVIADAANALISKELIKEAQGKSDLCRPVGSPSARRCFTWSHLVIERPRCLLLEQ